jgi:hypothetical protein
MEFFIDNNRIHKESHSKYSNLEKDSSKGKHKKINYRPTP